MLLYCITNCLGQKLSRVGNGTPGVRKEGAVRCSFVGLDCTSQPCEMPRGICGNIED
jgi:hypothetical protein